MFISVRFRFRGLSILADRLAHIIELRGLNQSSAARQCGIAQALMSGLINEKRKSPAADTIKKLAIGLKVSSDYLLGIDIDNAMPAKIAQSKEHHELCKKILSLPKSQISTVAKVIEALSIRS